ncbi:MAG: hypothetical protein HDS46_05280 [Bacteroides sp.]|nr:hypothetical protein [Bacteroides sp.]MDE6038945.1 hypothetical protein [Paramuribaculum sp.]
MTNRPTALKHWRFRRVLGAPRRWASRRGFGIHSPFAFDFVRRVIASHCHYYCYDRLARLAKVSTLSAPTLRLLFRLALFFRPQTFAVAGAEARVIARAVAEGSPTALDAGNGGADMLIVSGPVSELQLRQTIEREGVIVVLDLRNNRRAMDTVWRMSRHGMLFRGSTKAVFVAHAHLPHQAFSVWI